MLTSYKSSIGRTKSSILNASAVGVITAAVTDMMIMAYLYFLLNVEAFIIPSFERIRLRTGI